MTTLERILAEALTDIVVGLDLSEDDAITPTAAAMAVPEPVIALLQRLLEPDRQALADRRRPPPWPPS
ncbi:hypothetical protein [Nonomuraea sp. NPDC049400]|uniref:hypothetical protein n=1 Tax=Nonomuraea sp. NPDC049400 TaxID=3364352 RepID=UPI00378C40A8